MKGKVQVFWPDLPSTDFDDADLIQFLDSIDHIMSSRPSTKDASLCFDEGQIHADAVFIASFDGDITSALQALISDRQAQSAHLHLNPVSVGAFRGYPRLQQLAVLASEGARPIMKPGFTPNRGVNEDCLRPQYYRLKDAIHHQLAKLQRRHEALVLPKSLLLGWDHLHVSATHVVLKLSDSKGRVCSDPRSSGLNDGTDLEAIYSDVGRLELPSLPDLAHLVVEAKARGDVYLSKFDVSSAFNKYKLHWSLVGLLACEVEDFFVLPLVGIFGWSACPAYYDLISKAVDWALQGGIPDAVLDQWRVQLALPPVVRQPEWLLPSRLKLRCCTYVDDTTVFSSYGSIAMDHADVVTIIKFLMCDSAVNEDKTEGPSLQLESIGWRVDMVSASISPSLKGICKLCYFVLRAVPPSCRSVSVDMLHSMLGVMRHYATVLPLLYGSLNHLQGQLVAALNSPSQPRYLNLTAASQRDLDMWRLTLLAGLHNHTIWTCPAKFLQRSHISDADFIVHTDASTSIGGGYIAHEISFGHWIWSLDEFIFFSKNPTHINSLELATVVIAIFENVEKFRNSTVLVFVDNTSAISWINSLRSSSPEAHPWIVLLLLICVCYNIHICATHIAGQNNVVADALSRNVQEVITQVGHSGLLRPGIMTPESRLRIFQMACGQNGSWDLWLWALNLLTAQGSIPSDTSVKSSLLFLSSLRKP